MTKVEQLQQEVDDIVSSINNYVIVGVFEKLEIEHIKHADHFRCQCTYCQILRNYVALKIYYHHCNKMIRNFDGVGLCDYLNDHWSHPRFNRLQQIATTQFNLPRFVIRRKEESGVGPGGGLFVSDIDYTDIENQFTRMQGVIKRLRGECRIAKL